MKGSLNRLLENPKYKEKFDRQYELFKLEVQILNAMEDKGWTYADLAKAVGTSKQNIWRDLKDGGIQKASFDRIGRIASALGLHFHPILLDRKKEKKILPKIKKLLEAA